MDSILVKGNGALNGVIPIAGAKNACLTLMPATLLTEEPLTLTNAPRLSDIQTMTQLLQSLGAEVASLPAIARIIEPDAALKDAFDAGHARFRAAQSAIRGLT